MSVPAENPPPAVTHPSSEMRTGHLIKLERRERGNPVTTSSYAFGESTVHYFLMLFRIFHHVIHLFVDKYFSVYPPVAVSSRSQLFFWQLGEKILCLI